jgi:hypothetical protein
VLRDSILLPEQQVKELGCGGFTCAALLYKFLCGKGGFLIGQVGGVEVPNSNPART